MKPFDQFITNLLQQQGEIPFVEFMHHALYAPQVGYYSANLTHIGQEGDFITAPELTSLFGYTLANQCQEILACVSHPVLFEFGAGTGRLCVDLLRRLEALDALPDTYQILEVSPTLRQRQQETIHQTIPHLASRIRWLSEWPTEPMSGVVVANEVLDAMPVHRFLQTESGVLESHIGLGQEGTLQERFHPCTHERLLAHVNEVLPKMACPYLSEANLFVDGWLKQVSHSLTDGAVLICDYGFPRHEYYHPDRNQGTLMCHYRHQAHTNPLAHPGEEDITAHVDFTHVAEAALKAGFHVAGFTNQAAFLLANGLLTLLADLSDERLRVRAQQAVKQLVQPNEMGELFKVIALTKGIERPLTGFQLQDKRASL